MLMEALDASEKEKNEIEEIAMEKLAIMSNEVADIKAIHRFELAEQLGEYAELFPSYRRFVVQAISLWHLPARGQLQQLSAQLQQLSAQWSRCETSATVALIRPRHVGCSTTRTTI